MEAIHPEALSAYLNVSFLILTRYIFISSYLWDSIRKFISKSYIFHSFHLFTTTLKIEINMVMMEEYVPLLFWGGLSNIKIFDGALNFVLNTGPHGKKNVICLKTTMSTLSHMSCKCFSWHNYGKCPCPCKCPAIPKLINLFCSVASCFRVTGHFETNSLNDLKMTLYFEVIYGLLVPHSPSFTPFHSMISYF